MPFIFEYKKTRGLGAPMRRHTSSFAYLYSYRKSLKRLKDKKGQTQ